MTEQLDADELRRELIRPGSSWRRLDVVPETGSTNVDLAARARRDEPGGSVLVTGYQSAGRGRQGRSWTAPRDTGVAVSVLLRPPPMPPERWSWLPLLAGLAVADGIRASARLPATLKWPNDVLIGGKKVCGVLAERVESPLGAACVVGMGINRTLTEADLPVPTATSLALAAAAAGPPATVPTPNALVGAVLAVLDLLVGRWQSGADEVATAAAYRERCVTLGRQVRVLLGGDRSVTGVAEEIDTTGRLVLRTSAGRQVFGAGDVVHLRS